MTTHNQSLGLRRGWGRWGGKAEIYIYRMGERELSYGVFHENAGFARTCHPRTYPRLRLISRLDVEEFDKCPLDLMRPRESHEIRPQATAVYDGERNL